MDEETELGVRLFKRVTEVLYDEKGAELQDYERRHPGDVIRIVVKALGMAAAAFVGRQAVVLTEQQSDVLAENLAQGFRNIVWESRKTRPPRKP